MCYEIVEGERAFLEFESDYRSLYQSARTGNPFASPEWIYTWYAHYRDQGTPTVIAIYSDIGRRLVCAFALFRTTLLSRRARADRIVPMAYDCADYLEPLMDKGDDSVRDLLAQGLRRLANRHQCEIVMPQVPETQAKWLGDALSQHAIYHVKKPASVCPYARLTGSFAEFLQSRFSAKTRQTFRRKQRRLNDHGEISIKVASGAQAPDDLLTIIWGMEVQSWKGDQHVGLFSSPRAGAFHADALSKLALQGQARISVLTLAGAPIAYEIGLVGANRYMMYGTGYLPSYRQYSPGALLMLKNIEHAFEAGHQIYDFMRGDEDYKRQWATHTARNQAISVFGSGITGWLDYRRLQAYDKLRSAARKMVHGGSADRADRYVEHLP